VTKVHGKSTFVSVNGTDISSHSNNVEWKRAGDSHDITTFGNNSHRKQGGLLDGSTTLTGIYDNVAGTGPRAVLRPLIGTVVPVVYRSEGTGAGRPQDTVNGLLVSYEETAPVADMVTWEAEFEFDGDVTSVTQ
jgi:hypothetical protein